MKINSDRQVQKTELPLSGLLTKAGPSLDVKPVIRNLEPTEHNSSKAKLESHKSKARLGLAKPRGVNLRNVALWTLGMHAASRVGRVAAQWCDPNDFSCWNVPPEIRNAFIYCGDTDFACWEQIPEPLHLMDALQDDLVRLDFGECPSVCMMTPGEVSLVAQTASATGAIVGHVIPHLPKKARVAMAVFGIAASVKTYDFFAAAKQGCAVKGCPTFDMPPLFNVQ